MRTIKIDKNLMLGKTLLCDYIFSHFFMLENEHMLIFEHKNEHMKWLICFFF